MQAYGYAPPPTAPLAIWSLALGLGSFAMAGPLASIPGVICGHLALRRIRQSNGVIQGRGMAIGGLVAGYINILLCLVVIGGIVFIVHSVQADKRDRACRQHLSQIGVACKAYARANNDQLPPDLRSLAPYLANGDINSVLKCAENKDGTPAYEIVAKGTLTQNPNPRTVMVRETTARHRGKRYGVFIDTQVGPVP